VTLVAGWLLDSNNPAKIGHDVSQEYRANLEQNLNDAVARIPKLTTGTSMPIACWHPECTMSAPSMQQHSDGHLAKVHCHVQAST
jgi:hypothetical protein